MSTSVGSTTTFFVGAHYEVVVTDTGTQVNKYYFAGTQRIAMRKDTTLYYLLSDHLGSTSIVTDAAGTVVSQTRYKAWGEVRHQSGVTPTEYGYTGQFSDSYINLLWYGSRHYDPELGRFIQPDSIVPLALQGVQAWDRYAYVNNSPINYIDPSGHSYCDSEYAFQEDCNGDDLQYDVTEILVEELQEAGEEGSQLTEMYDEQGGFFYVYSYMFGKYWRYGPKNIKEEMLNKIGEGVILCGGDGCRWVDYSTPGNILFGYAVEAAGMSEEFYSWVGGFEQMGDDLINPNEPVHTEWCSSSYCDDPHDLAAVQFGAQLYQEHGSDITLEIFQNELTTDILDTFQPPPADFPIPFSPYPQGNNYHLGDFDYGR